MVPLAAVSKSLIRPVISSILESDQIYIASVVFLSLFISQLWDNFAPEFLNRIDEIIIFNILQVSNSCVTAWVLTSSYLKNS